MAKRNSRSKRFIPTCVGNMFRRWAVNRFGNGSSPRVWGTFANAQRSPVFGRFIPTCVGNIPDETRKAQQTTVHPHVCGEHFAALFRLLLYYGSSPRVWGTCRIPHETDRSGRFIPTCVGNISTTFAAPTVVTVHPHVCGEHPSAQPGFFRARRFIPTCVGNMLPCLFAGAGKFGSSPRVWGT